MYAEPIDFESPHWSGQVRRRLRVSMLVSAVCVAAMLLVLQFPVARQAGPVTELIVQILIDEVETAAETVAEESAREDLHEATDDDASELHVPADAVQESATAAAPVDWYALLPDTAKAAAERAARTVSVNPVFDEKRRHASVKFAPSKAPQATPIWENVEKDALGRSVLKSGDCYRVIDDPNVGSREAFEIFGQYITMCSSSADVPRNLPWVSEIRSRRASQARSVPRAAE